MKFLNRITQKIHKKYPVLDVKHQEMISPFLRNKEKHLNPALQFVKTVCKVSYLPPYPSPPKNLYFLDLILYIKIGTFIRFWNRR